MGTIEVYSFEDADGPESGSFTTTDPNEAHDYARRRCLRMIANTYEWSDSETVHDYT